MNWCLLRCADKDLIFVANFIILTIFLSFLTWLIFMENSFPHMQKGSKHRKMVRMKKLVTNNSKIFICTMKKTSVNYRMVPTLLPCFYPLCHFKIYNDDLCIYICFQYFSKKFTDYYLSNHLHGQDARKVFIQTHNSILKCS